MSSEIFHSFFDKKQEGFCFSAEKFVETKIYLSITNSETRGMIYSHLGVIFYTKLIKKIEVYLILLIINSD